MSRLAAVLEASWAGLERRKAEEARRPKSFQNLRKTDDFGLLGLSWAPLGPSWSDLGTVLGRLGPFVARKGDNLENLEKPKENQ